MQYLKYSRHVKLLESDSYKDLQKNQAGNRERKCIKSSGNRVLPVHVEQYRCCEDQQPGETTVYLIKTVDCTQPIRQGEFKNIYNDIYGITKNSIHEHQKHRQKYGDTLIHILH